MATAKNVRTPPASAGKGGQADPPEPVAADEPDDGKAEHEVLQAFVLDGEELAAGDKVRLDQESAREMQAAGFVTRRGDANTSDLMDRAAHNPNFRGISN